MKIVLHVDKHDDAAWKRAIEAVRALDHLAGFIGGYSASSEACTATFECKRSEAMAFLDELVTVVGLIVDARHEHSDIDEITANFRRFISEY